MKKIIATLLIFAVTLQLPFSSHASSNDQAKALQLCFDEIISQSLNAQNVAQVDFGEGKYLDRLAATKSLMVWSLGDEYQAMVYTKSEEPMLDTLLKQKLGLISGSLLASSAIASAFNTVMKKSTYKNYKTGKIKNATAMNISKALRARIIWNVITLALTGTSTFLIYELDKSIEYHSSPGKKSEYITNLLNADTELAFNRALHDDESETAFKLRKRMIVGCQELRNHIQHFIDMPDLFVSDLQRMNRNEVSPIVLDSADLNIPGVFSKIKIPSLENALVAKRKDETQPNNNSATNASVKNLAADNGFPVTLCEKINLNGIYKKEDRTNQEKDVYVRFESQFNSSKAYQISVSASKNFPNDTNTKSFQASVSQIYASGSNINHCGITEYANVGQPSIFLILSTNNNGSFVSGDKGMSPVERYDFYKQ
jgi:hypothetical protein